MADAAMADAEDVASGSRPAGATKKGKVDYVQLEADVQAQLQAASQARASRAACVLAFPPSRRLLRTHTMERRSPKTAKRVCVTLRRGVSLRRWRRC
jgi:hypothetical protein